MFRRRLKRSIARFAGNLTGTFAGKSPLAIRLQESEDGSLIETELSPEILQAISEAVTWCTYRRNAGYPIRSPELDPFAILDIPGFSHGSESIGAWIEKKRDCYHRATSWISQTRSRLLKAASLETSQVVDGLSRSKLLIYFPLETVDDGAAEAASSGFYDLQDAPPWDTWILFADDAIFCCVPEFAVPYAQDGIDANPVDCIHWASWSKLARIQQ